jgi:ribonuclease HI
MSHADTDLELVVTQERRLLDPRCRASRECLRDLLHPDFREHGTSGRVWSLQDVLTDLPADPTFDGEAVDFDATRLAPDVILLTFRTITTERTSLRSSVWVRCQDGQWRMRFHQGTRVG